MPTVLRSLAAMAAVATFVAPLSAQRSPAPAPAPRVSTPAIPPMPAVPQPGQSPEEFGQAMGRWGESLGQAMRVMADSLGRIASQLGAAEADQAVKRTDAGTARVDSLKRALNEVERSMRDAKAHGHDWRAFGHQVREHARAAAAQGTSFAAAIERVRQDPEALAMPPADSFTTGSLSIAAGTQHAGTAAIVNGNMQVYGTVSGNAIAVNGNVLVHPGGHVTGNALAGGGEVRVDSGGMIDGEIRSLTGDFGPVATTAGRHVSAPVNSRLHNVRMALMALAFVLVLSIGVLTFAEEQLDHVTATLADRFGRSAWYGLAGAVAIAPVLALMTVALTITVVGILVVPFAAVAYIAMTIGAALLGFIAVAEATGNTILPGQTQGSLTHRGAQLRAIVTGVSIYGGLWVLTAIVGTESGFGIGVRSVAVAVSAVAVTVGFGAVILWRFDVRKATRVAAASKTALDDAVWQTPTPVAGVAAARRTEPAATSSGRPS